MPAQTVPDIEAIIRPTFFDDFNRTPRPPLALAGSSWPGSSSRHFRRFMKTLEQIIAEIEAFYNPKIAARQVAYDAYLQLSAARDEKIRRAQEWFAKRAERDRLSAELGEGPEV